MFEVMPKEPWTDRVAVMYKNYRDVRVRVLAFMKNASERRATQANRHRPLKEVEIHQHVLVRDPRLRKAGGRTPWKNPMEPCEVVELRGPNRIIVKPFQSNEQREVHMEDVVLLPEDYNPGQDPEGWKFPDPEPLYSPEDLRFKRSPGMMLEQPQKKETT